jgi:hypothetical protein
MWQRINNQWLNNNINGVMASSVINAIMKNKNQLMK